MAFLPTNLESLSYFFSVHHTNLLYVFLVILLWFIHEMSHVDSCVWTLDPPIVTLWRLGRACSRWSFSGWSESPRAPSYCTLSTSRIVITSTKIGDDNCVHGCDKLGHVVLGLWDLLSRAIFKSLGDGPIFLSHIGNISSHL